MAVSADSIWKVFVLDGDKWAGAWRGLPGWESHDVSVTTALVHGEPRVVGLVVQPKRGVAVRDQVLTSNRLRTLPVTALAASAHAVLAPTVPTVVYSPDLMARLDEFDAQNSKPTGRAVTTVERVAQVYADALLKGEAPRKAVCQVLSISPRTADRYISEARRRGLLPPYKERKAGGNRAEAE